MNSPLLPTALITGAGSGIGRATAQQFAANGLQVYAIGRNQQTLEETCAGLAQPGKIIPVCADVTDLDNFNSAVSPLPPLDIIVINAGVCRRAAIGDAQSNEIWNDVILTNLTGAWNTIHALHDKIRNGGRIVAVSSGLGKLGRAEYTAYTASKHGLLGMVKCLSKELAPRGITVNAVCPGWVDTEMAQRDLRVSAAQNATTPDVEYQIATSAIPLGRFVQPVEVAQLIAFLAGPQASAITGQSYNISGGEFTC